MWEGQREMRSARSAESPFIERYLQRRADRSLEHVFTLLSLALPSQPLQIAFRGLHTRDSHLRGTALEYLESVLPHAIREELWPYLEDTRGAERVARPRERVLEGCYARTTRSASASRASTPAIDDLDPTRQVLEAVIGPIGLIWR